MVVREGGGEVGVKAGVADCNAMRWNRLHCVKAAESC